MVKKGICFFISIDCKMQKYNNFLIPSSLFRLLRQGIGQHLKVHLVLEKVYSFHTDAHLVPQLDDTTRLLPYDTEVVVVEIIIVARKVFVAHQTLAFVAFQFHKQTPFADT